MDTPSSLMREIQNAETQFLKGPSSPYTAYLHTECNIQIPWIFDDGNPSTWEDEFLYRTVQIKIQEIKSYLEEAGFVEGTASYNWQLGQELHTYFLSTDEEGGLGIKYDPFWVYQEDPVQFYVHGQRTACHGYEALFKGAALLAGLSVSFYEKVWDGKVYHSLAGIHYDPDNLRRIALVDPDNTRLVNLEDESDSHDITRVTELDFIAADHLNKEAYNYFGETEKLEKEREELVQALRFAPENESVHYAWGVWLVNQAENEESDQASNLLRQATTHFQKVLALNPHTPLRNELNEVLRKITALNR